MSGINELLGKMDSHDADIRFMALNDLQSELQKSTYKLDDNAERRLVDTVLKMVRDSNGEVQNLAVQCLGALARKVQNVRLQDMIDQLCQLVAQKEQASLREVASLGLKIVVVEIPAGTVEGAYLSSKLVPKLLVQLSDSELSNEAHMDQLDLLAESLARFGHVMQPAQLADVQRVVLPMLDHQRAATRKRATIVIGNLVRHTSGTLFEELADLMQRELSSKTSRPESTRTAVICLNAICRNNPQRFSNYINKFLPLVVEHAQTKEDDDLREQCLQTLETFVLRCPAAVKPHLETVTTLCLQQITYDPNYAVDESDEDDTMEDGGGEDEEDEDEEDEDYEDVISNYSDDDDTSWKVRRGATKTLAGLIGTRPEYLVYFYEQVAPKLVSRFNEREETVRIEVLQAFIGLLRQTAVHAKDGQVNGVSADTMSDTDTSTDTNASLRLLGQLIPRICQRLAKQMRGKSKTITAATRQTGFSLLANLVQVLHQSSLTSEQFELFVPVLTETLTFGASGDQQYQTQHATSSQQLSSSASSLKIEAILFLRQVVRHLPLSVFAAHLVTLVPALCSATHDRFYKISAEAIRTCGDLVVAMTLAESPADVSIDAIYDAVQSHARTLDADQEVRERSVDALGILCARASKQIPLSDALAILLERCGNEGTQVAALRALRSTVQSDTATDAKVQPIIQQVVGQGARNIVRLVRTGRRPTKIGALSCIVAFIEVYGDNIPREQYVELIDACRLLINDDDLQLLPLALNCTAAIVMRKTDLWSLVNSDITVYAHRLVVSPLVQGSPLEALTRFYAAMAKANPAQSVELFDHLFTLCTSNTQSTAAATSKQVYTNIARCAAVCCLQAPNKQKSVIAKLIQQAETTSNSESLRCASLQTLGEIGRSCDLSDYEQLHAQLLGLISDKSEDVKVSASFALGNLAAGNVPLYLPLIIQEIKLNDNRRYLLLNALKETITRYSSDDRTQLMEKYADEIWDLLYTESSTDEETSKNVVAECIGRLTLANPSKFLPELQTRIQSDSARWRAASIAAVKFTFTSVQSRAYDDLLRPLLVEFLSLMKDDDLTVRHLSLTTLNSVVHNKPQLVRDVLDQLLPLLYKETVIRPELIHTVDMGPFKYQVDDGLDVRKAAYECMCTLLDSCVDRVETSVFLDHVIPALSDQHDIRILVYLILTRLIRVAPTSVIQRLDDIADPLKATLTRKLKENAVKQEVEKNRELVRSALRVLAALATLPDHTTSLKFDTLLRETRTGPLAEELRVATTETENREQYRLGNGNYRAGDDMELC
ncbi:armadillo-type protein [Syncephalis fuscata]|nr:armadillo-type protein [Syncephalis fuscata]